MGNPRKRWLLSIAGSLWLVAGSAYAMTPGLYMGLMLGPAHNKAKTVPLALTSGGAPVSNIKAKPKTSEFGARIFLGYQVNPYGSVEGGFSYFSNIRYTVNSPQIAASTLSARMSTVDFVGKAELPWGPVSLFAKGGMALTLLRTTSGLNSATTNKKTSDTLVRPTYSIGASYAISPEWVTDLTWTRVMMGKVVSSMDFYGIGIRYHFIDEYCGQFLCN